MNMVEILMKIFKEKGLDEIDLCSEIDYHLLPADKIVKFLKKL
jgi:hypothetical protein